MSEDIIVSKRSQTVLRAAVALLAPLVLLAGGFALEARVQMARFETAISGNKAKIGQVEKRLEGFEAEQRKDDRERREVLHKIDKRLTSIETTVNTIAKRRR